MKNKTLDLINQVESLLKQLKKETQKTPVPVDGKTTAQKIKQVVDEITGENNRYYNDIRKDGTRRLKFVFVQLNHNQMSRINKKLYRLGLEDVIVENPFVDGWIRGRGQWQLIFRYNKDL